MPSSCANDMASPTAIHASLSKRLAGLITSSSHLPLDGLSTSGAPPSRWSCSVSMISESQPSAAGGTCSARGCHSVSSNSASMEPIVRVLALDAFSWPSRMRISKCWQ